MSERDELQDEALARLYREASKEQPSAGLDARVLGAARAAAAVPRAGNARPRAAANSWVSSWRIPVALAAMVLLTTTLTLMVRDEEAGRLSEPEVGANVIRAPQPAPMPASKSAPLVTPAKPKSVHSPNQTQPAEGMAATQDRALPQSGAVPAARSGEQPAASGPEAFVPDLPRSAGSLSGQSKGAQVAPQRDDLRSGNMMKDQPALEKARPAVQAAPPAMESTVAPQRPAAAGAQSRVMQAPAPAAKRAHSAEQEPRSPEQWLADIRKLRLAGKVAEAEASLAEFSKRYPQYTLPEDLKRP